MITNKRLLIQSDDAFYISSDLRSAVHGLANAKKTAAVAAAAAANSSRSKDAATATVAVVETVAHFCHFSKVKNKARPSLLCTLPNRRHRCVKFLQQLGAIELNIKTKSANKKK